MTIWRLITEEIRFRRLGFASGVLSILVATGCLIAAMTLLRTHDTRAERMLAERERATREEMERLEDDYRRIMRDLGHNVLVIHQDQDLSELQALGHPRLTMPEAYAHRLGLHGSKTLNHLLPVLQHRATWPERGVEILLSGTPGQIPVVGRERFLAADGMTYRNPIIRALPPGMVRIGHSLARRFDLKPGDTTTLNGEDLRVEQVLPQEGSIADIAVWVDLDRAQSWLGLEGKINGILGLECICRVDALGVVDKDVRSILPDVQVLEFSSRVTARALARQRAGQAHAKALEAEAAHQETMRRERRLFAAVLVPLAVAVALIWIFMLTLGNVRERRGEIGILRALGVGQGAIMMVFLLKAVLMGGIGAVLGLVAGIVVTGLWGGIPPDDPEFWPHIQPGLVMAALLIAPALCALAAWLPAVRAAAEDPAVVLRDWS